MSDESRLLILYADGIEHPIRELGLEPFLASAEITSADETDCAESLSGKRALGKPHWFSPACATVGFEAALDALSGDEGTLGVVSSLGELLALLTEPRS